MKPFKVSSLLKNILLLSTGTGIAQVIPMLASIILARLYTNNDYGDLSVFISVTGIIGVIATLSYELTIILPKKTDEARNLLALCLVNSLIIGLLSAIIIVILNLFFRNRLHISGFNWLYWIPVMVICTGIYNSFDNWFNRQHEFKNMASLKVIQSAATSSFRILLGIVGITWGLIGGTVIGYVIIAFASIVLFLKKNTIEFASFTCKKMQKMAVSYKDFSLFATPSALLNSASIIGLPLLITYFYSVKLAGIYFFANNLIRTPISLFSSATAQVFKSEAVQLIHAGQIENLKNLIRKVQKTAFLLIFPVVLILSLFGNSIFSFLFGAQWGASGDLIKYFAFYLLFGTNFSIISAMIDILRLQKLNLLFNASLLFSQIIIFALCSFYMNFEHTVFVNFLVGSLHFIFIDRYIKRKLK